MPEEYIGTIIGDLNSRRGRIEGIEMVGGLQAIKATVPLSNMFGYATAMRGGTQGRANFSMEFKRYEACPNKGDFGDDEPDTGGAVPKWPRPRNPRSAASSGPDLNPQFLTQQSAVVAFCTLAVLLVPD